MDEEQAEWLKRRLARVAAPTTFKERNWVQYILITQYSKQFGTDELTSLQHVAGKFADHFPH